MFARVCVLCIVALVLGLSSTALAQEQVSPASADWAWHAAYWNNTTLSGSPVVERAEAELKHYWGTGSPHPSVNADRFSARWTRTIDVTEDLYRFTATSDDGIRVWVDNALIINEWNDHAAATFTAERHLNSGQHRIVVEFFENQGVAAAAVTWGYVDVSKQNWRGEYWNNTTHTGTPDLTRYDNEIDFDWGGLSPAPSVINADNFSARWMRAVNLPAGRYRFSMTVDDGGRLWVNNDLLIDAWSEQPATTYTAETYLPEGAIPIRMDYFEKGGRAVAKLKWEMVSPTYPNWLGEYFNNKTLSGTPSLVRGDEQVNFDWGAGSPAPGAIEPDRFSARWTRRLDLEPGRYRFEMTSDDGARLWVNNQLVIDAWRDQAATTYPGEIDLPGGSVPIKMEYFENAGLAVARLSWYRTPVPSYIWRGEYYNNMTLSGSPSVVRNDSQIDFDWGTGSPASGLIGADHFSVRWTRDLNLTGGHYRFSITVDDGARLWVNDQLLIDAWQDQAATTYTQDIYLTGGAIPVRMEYYENARQAVARLSWTMIGKIDTPGTVIVDNNDPGFSRGGSVTGWREAYEGYGGRLHWTKNNDWKRPAYNWARWYPSLIPAHYEVFVYIPERYSTTAHATYWISHADGFTSRVVDQSANGGRWVSLGTYRFRGTKSDYVSLNDVTGEPRLSRLIAFDAVKWALR